MVYINGNKTKPYDDAVYLWNNLHVSSHEILNWYLYPKWGSGFLRDKWFILSYATSRLKFRKYIL